MPEWLWTARTGRKEKYIMTNKTLNLAITALMSAVLCVISPLSIPIGTVPISLTTMFIIIGVFLIGPIKMSISVLIYILIGVVGLPVFANFKSGPGVIAGPTGGYIVGYVVLALVSGAIAYKDINNIRYAIIGLVAGNLLEYAIGTAWLSYSMQLTFVNALMIGVVPFVIADVIKMALATYLGKIIRRRIK